MRNGASLWTPVRSAVEREVKLAVDAAFRLPALNGSRLRTKVLTSTYFDTPDLRLARARITLRHRTEGRKRLWQLKLPLECGRREIEMPGRASAPPHQILDLLFIHLQRGTVGPVATLRTRRTGTRVGGEHGADVVLDDVAVLKASSEVLTFREVEIERLNGNAALVARLEKRLRKAGATDHDARPKLFRALDLPAPRTPEPPEPGDPPGAHLIALLGGQLDTLLSRDPGVRLGGESEDVHQMRVATRRMRSILRVARPLVDREWAAPLRERLRWLGRRLGEARDLDVQIAYFTQQADGLTRQDRAAFARFLDSLERRRRKVQRKLLRQLRRRRYVDLINRLIIGVREPVFVPYAVTLPELAWKAFRRLCKAVKRLDGAASDATWHGVRIRAKRARYAAELAERCIGPGATRFIERLKTVQDLLGEIQDAVMAEESLRRFARKKGGRSAAVLLGRMVERQRRRRRDAKNAFPRAWKNVQTSGEALEGTAKA